MGNRGPRLTIFMAKWQRVFDSVIKPVYTNYESIVVAEDIARAKHLIYKHYGPLGVNYVNLKPMGLVNEDAPEEFQKEGFFLTKNTP